MILPTQKAANVMALTVTFLVCPLVLLAFHAYNIARELPKKPWI